MMALLPLLLIAAPVRLGLVVGNNTGVLDDAPLRYATRDAERVHGVLTTIGATDALLLTDAGAEEVERAFATLERSVARAHRDGGSASLVVHYSGHADERFLHLSGTRMTIDRLLELVRASQADVTVLVLDACRNRLGAAAKGAAADAPLGVEIGRDRGAHGRIVIRSVREGEVAVESEAMKGSIFTHHWIAALQGAADSDGDRRVTLAEAYALAKKRTVRSTLEALGAPQHPTYELELEGEEDLVLTDLAQADAQLIFPEELRGRFYVAEGRDGSLFSEVVKDDRSVRTLALPRGEYLIYTAEQEEVRIAEVSLVWRREVVLGGGDFQSHPRASVVTKEGRMVVRRTAISAGAELDSGWLDGMPPTLIGRAGASYRIGSIEWSAGVVGGRFSFDAKEARVDNFAVGLSLGASWVIDQSFGSWATALELRPLWMRQQLDGGDRFDVFVGQVRLGEQLRVPLFAGARVSFGAGVSVSTFKAADRIEVRPSLYGVAGVDYAF